MYDLAVNEVLIHARHSVNDESYTCNVLAEFAAESRSHIQIE